MFGSLLNQLSACVRLLFLVHHLCTVTMDEFLRLTRAKRLGCGFLVGHRALSNAMPFSGACMRCY